MLQVLFGGFELPVWGKWRS